ncbi:MAG: hypothetical protein HY331_06990 [Chloroflexi bacterium]|nr:hypothetical protein [Chloroflexota bacterium]
MFPQSQFGRQLRSLAPLLLSLLALLGVAGCGASASQPAAGGPAPTGSGLVDRADVVVHRGIHTVHHSTAPLPSPGSPRADGRFTVAWFSATW